MGRDFLASIRRPLQVAAWLTVALLCAYVLTAWVALSPLPRLRSLWLASLVAGLIVAGFASARIWLGEAHTWRQSTVSWRTVALDLGGFVLTAAACWSLAIYVCQNEGWL